MTAPRPFFMADPVKTAWAAGLIEGEGSFSVMFRRRSAAGDRDYYVFRIRVAMTDRDVIERLHAVFGVGRLDSYANNGLGKKRLYRWDVAKAGEVRDVCAAVYPYMGERRRAQIERLLGVLETNPPLTNAERVRRTWITRKARRSA